MAIPLPAGATIECASNPGYPAPYQARILGALAELGVPPLAIPWDSFTAILLKPENKAICRHQFPSDVFLHPNHYFDTFVIVRKEDKVLGMLALSFYTPDGLNARRNMTALYVNQICVAAEAKGLGTHLLALTDRVAQTLGSETIKLIAGTSASNHKGPTGLPKLLQYYLNNGYNWVNQGYKSLDYPTLVKPMTPAAAAAHVAVRANAEERAAARAREQAEAQAAWAAQVAAMRAAYPSGGNGTPPAGGAGGGPAVAMNENGVPLPTAARPGKPRRRKRRTRRTRKN